MAMPNCRKAAFIIYGQEKSVELHKSRRMAGAHSKNRRKGEWWRAPLRQPSEASARG